MGGEYMVGYSEDTSFIFFINNYFYIISHSLIPPKRDFLHT